MEILGKSLEFWAFAWLLFHEVISAVAMLLGGIPVLQWILPAASPAVVWTITGALLRILWLAAGVAGGFLLYRWIKNGKVLFRNTARPLWVKVGFILLLVTAFNTAIAAIAVNVLFLFMPFAVMVLAAVVNLFVAGYLFMAWKKNGYALF